MEMITNLWPIEVCSTVGWMYICTFVLYIILKLR
jgi:hypothetical protein